MRVMKDEGRIKIEQLLDTYNTEEEAFREFKNKKLEEKRLEKVASRKRKAEARKKKDEAAAEARNNPKQKKLHIIVGGKGELKWLDDDELYFIVGVKSRKQSAAGGARQPVSKKNYNAAIKLNNDINSTIMLKNKKLDNFETIDQYSTASTTG
mmetsp:Transcript_9683/g.10434  ORF Transcript_9683/g.10434 Transcript_9683/m.10434 type:complete len:153 (+) Transcript_9683:197-655(+)